MLAWLKRRLGRRAQSRRLIFSYRAGGKSLAADPIVVQRVLESNGSAEWRTLFSVVNALAKPPSDAEASMMTTEEAWRARAARRDAAIFELAALSRHAFGLPELTPDGEGVTEAEAIDVLSRFIEFIGGLAEKARPFAT